MQLQTILNELEKLGSQNDSVQNDKSRKYLNITKDTGEFLHVVVKATKAKHILEIGTSNGYSTIWLASALPEDGMVTTIDISPQKISEAKRNLEKAQLNNFVQVLTGDVCDILGDLDNPFDIIFLDADRSSYISILPSLQRLLKPGGLMICDNAVSHKDELKEFMDFFTTDSRFATSLVPIGKGEFMIVKL